MTSQHRKLLQARIALALRAEWGRVPSESEIKRYAELASILFQSVGGALAMKSSMQRYKQLPIW